ncbi:hypothetical protein HMPREF3137_18805 [Achromobacter xylosoxidans]|nr:hypothetical protein HMPREF3137_18805 [Achromobacter xylosoxidans]
MTAAFLLMDIVMPRSAVNARYCPLAYCGPRSLFTSNALVGLRCHHADFKAVHTWVASMASDIDQSTMRRPARCITAATYNQPSPVGMYVMSAARA